MMTLRRLAVVPALVWLLPGPAATAYGQASPWLPAGHWTTPVLVRLHALGSMAGDPVVWLRGEAESAAALPAPYAARLAAERFGPVVHVETAAAFSSNAAVLRPGGFTVDREWTGPTAERDLASAGIRVRAASVPREWFALTAELSAWTDALVLEHASIGVTAGPFVMWGGRRAFGYRPGAGGGLVLTAVERFDGAGVQLARPRLVPLLGGLTGEVFAGPLPRNGLVSRPWLLGMRVHVRPHPRLDAGATRAAVFGATGTAGLGIADVARVLVGANLTGAYADDQVASVDARWRPPLGSVHAELYGEWGMHDVDAGVLFDVPAFTIGVRLPQVAARELDIALEHTQISGSCCSNPPWYHHFELADGWSAQGELLGHPLGGQGREWRASATGAAADAAVLLRMDAALRTRGAENLFAPDREGRAVMVEVAADVHCSERLGAEVRLLAERGATWTEVRTATALRWRL